MNEPTPQNAVFSTPELLVAILEHLTIQELLRVQIINQRWRETINSSPRLQKILFFKPCPDTNPPTFNPFLYSEIPLWFPAPDDSSPFAQSTWIQGSNLFESHISTLDASNELIFMRRDATWTRMLLIQPPVTELRILRMDGYEYELEVESRATLHFHDGLRMGQLWDICSDVLRQQGVHVRVEWGMFKRDVNEVEKEVVEQRRIYNEATTWPYYGIASSKLDALLNDLNVLKNTEAGNSVLLRIKVDYVDEWGRPITPAHSFRREGQEDLNIKYKTVEVQQRHGWVNGERSIPM